MLNQFSVKNYKSIREESVLDMTSTSGGEHQDSLISTKNGETCLPLVVIYGPNGGGKSNVLEALDALVCKVLRPILALEDSMQMIFHGNAQIVPFLFDESKHKATEFEVIFDSELAEYRYTLHVLNDVVVYESLDRRRMNVHRASVTSLFERTQEAGISLGGELKRLKISADMSATLPLLTYLGMTYRKNVVVNDVFNWFRNEVRFLDYGNPIQELGVAIAKGEKAKKLILKMMKEMSIDVDDFRVEKQNEEMEVYTTHIVNGISTEITFKDESKGTQKIFGLLPFVTHSLLSGGVLVVDELDAKLHPALLKYLIQLYTQKESNPHGGQLIFTSHDVSTMNNQLLRRDEIWFVAKGTEQNSKIYSLVEFKTQNGERTRGDARYDKQYLEGKYGADPYLQKLIDWREYDG